MSKKLITLPASVIAGGMFLIMPSLRRHPDLEELKKWNYAHRGLHDRTKGIPDNSLTAFSRAVEKGYGIELDVQLSKDGVPFVMHDMELARKVRNAQEEPVTGKGCDYDWETLQTFHLTGSEEKIPSFQEVLDLVNGRVPLIVELKVGFDDWKMPVCQAAMSLLENYHGLYCVESFHPGAVFWLRTHYPKVCRGQLSDCLYETLADGKEHPVLYRGAEYLIANCLTKPDFIAYNVMYERNPARRICRNVFKNTAVTWTVKSPEQYKKAKKHFDIIIFEGFEP